ncbi:hypothetical protein C453_03999 [Haloferax elongans ATCC BAA-1513]|uniref:Uncharacterized protein n=1 Tax=Haloferax elongans ATCC BAA-1513 TaxID=1230453 RepID=M0HWI8_HALEO|nr:hypothetical protein [Haloferax elongans]ELZ87484.1 hypothetical protein C453_03999 [Haloferax elongans ATCC BAA-1513]
MSTDERAAGQPTGPSLDHLEVVAFRKLLNTLAIPDDEERMNTDLGPIDAANRIVDRLDRLEQELEREREARKRAEELAEDALAMSKQIDDGRRPDGGPSKKEVAMRISRDEVIVRTAEGKNAGARNAAGKRADRIGSVSNSEVQSMARPQHDLYWQSVDDAWNELVSSFDAFYIDDSGEEKRLTVNPELLDGSLVRTVERSVGRSDLAKRLVGDAETDGGR